MAALNIKPSTRPNRPIRSTSAAAGQTEQTDDSIRVGPVRSGGPVRRNGKAFTMEQRGNNDD